MESWIGLLVLAAGAASATPDDDGPHGLEVGARAPAFSLEDQAGEDRSLADLLGQGKVALVFYRSADW